MHLLQKLNDGGITVRMKVALSCSPCMRTRVAQGIGTGFFVFFFYFFLLYCSVLIGICPKGEADRLQQAHTSTHTRHLGGKVLYLGRCRLTKMESIKKVAYQNSGCTTWNLPWTPLIRLFQPYQQYPQGRFRWCRPFFFVCFCFASFFISLSSPQAQARLQSVGGFLTVHRQVIPKLLPYRGRIWRVSEMM